MTIELNKKLNEAADSGDLETVKRMVQNGADIHNRQDWAFQLACFNGHLAVVKYLVSVGADIHAFDNLLERANFNGHLEVASYLKKQFLLEKLERAEQSQTV